jgi:hypothetical protein
MASVLFKADSSVLVGIPLNMLLHVGVNHCHICLKSCIEIFDSPGRDCINMFLQVSPQENIY